LLTPAQIAPGVFPKEDFLVYEVASESRPGMRHRVDFSEWSGFGSCSCEKFTCKIAPLLREGITPAVDMQCPHLARARLYASVEQNQGAITRRLELANENRKKNKHKPYQYEEETGAI